MLNKIYIKDFKCFDELNLELSNLNLLVGTNSSGKSTIIQSLLLIVNNMTNKTDSPLNGHLVSVGSFLESRNFITNAREFLVSVSSDLGNLEMRFFTSENDEECKCETLKKSKALKKFLNYNNKNIHYLSAKRIGSQDLYNKNFDRYDEFGIFGEYAIDYFEKNKNEPIEKYLINEKTSSTLGTQVNYWLKKILNTEIETEDINDTDRVKARYSYNENRKVRSKNIGSGVSYIISILVICLSSKKDDIIIIENPEIHLHPKAQSVLTEFFVFIANSDIQLLIETHSDHIFNGARKFISKKLIDKQKVSINFFTMDNESLSKHTKVLISDSGKILNYQKDLFDQFDNDLDDLLGL